MSTLQGAAQNQLRQFIEQIERLEEEKKAISDDIRDKFAEAKSVGFDVKALRTVLRLRKKSQTDRQEEEAIVETYMHALSMFDGTPMGAWITKQDDPGPLEDLMTGTASDEGEAPPPEKKKPKARKAEPDESYASRVADKYIPRNPSPGA